MPKNELLVAELAIRAFQASRDFKDYAQGKPVEDLTHDAKDVALTHFLYPLLQQTEDEGRRVEIRQEILRLQQSIGGG